MNSFGFYFVQRKAFAIDLFFGRPGECLTMRRFSSLVAVAAMLQALATAQLFHVHDHDDHGHAGSFVHAHFPESESQSVNSGHEIEPGHSHAHVRWVDLFTLSTPVNSEFQLVAEFSEPLSMPPPVVNRAVASVQTVRAHSPPYRSALPPRSPPAL
jgi:hypothetical protein